MFTVGGSALAGEVAVPAGDARWILGEGTEDSLSRVTFPSDLHIDAEFEIVTPEGNLYAANSVHVTGKLRDMDATGTELTLHNGDTALLTDDDHPKARLTGLNLVMRDALVGEHATI